MYVNTNSDADSEKKNTHGRINSVETNKIFLSGATYSSCQFDTFLI